MVSEVCRDGLWTLSLGLSQLHGHGSWLVCEVALSVEEAWPTDDGDDGDHHHHHGPACLPAFSAGREKEL